MENITNFGIDPKIWGPFYWYFLKSIAHNYPDNPNNEAINHVRGIFHGLQSALPCPECRQHYREYIKKHAIEQSLSNKKLLLNWINNLEQAIKKRNNEEDAIDNKNNIIPSRTLQNTGRNIKLNPRQ